VRRYSVLRRYALGLGVLRAGRTGNAGTGCLRRQLLLRAHSTLSPQYHALVASGPIISRLAKKSPAPEVSDAGRTRASVRRASNRKTQRLGPCSVAQNAAAGRPHTAAGANRTALGVRGVLHSPDALHDRLESRREHSGGQLGHAFGIVDSGFDPFLD
jgi:hypothetical protein